PQDDLPRVRGRIDREAADEAFEAYRNETQADPDNWRSWYRLGLAYDAAGDRKRARAALRDAITIYRGAWRFWKPLEIARNNDSNGPRTPANWRIPPRAMTSAQWTNSISHAESQTGSPTTTIGGQSRGHRPVNTTCTT